MRPTASAAMVEAYTTIGTPTATTGTPSVSRESASRRLPMPEPGLMPPSLSCTVRLMRPVLRAASASTQMTAAGRAHDTRPRTISPVSMPVVPSTPGAMADTARSPAGASSGASVRKCRVT